MTDLRKVADTLEMTIPYLPAKTATLSEVEETIEELRQAFAQPEQEPVGTYEGVMETMLSLRKGTLEQQQIYTHMKDKLLYTAPPKREWVGLGSDDDILEMSKDVWGRDKLNWGRSDHCSFYVAFAREVDKYLKDKNGG